VTQFTLTCTLHLMKAAHYTQHTTHNKSSAYTSTLNTHTHTNHTTSYNTHKTQQLSLHITQHDPILSLPLHLPPSLILSSPSLVPPPLSHLYPHSYSTALTECDDLRFIDCIWDILGGIAEHGRPSQEHPLYHVQQSV
jgi:hypothetical protein